MLRQWLKRHTTKSLLRKEKVRLLKELARMIPKSEEYKTTADQLEQLAKISTIESSGYTRVAPTIYGVVGNLTGLLLVMNYEKIGNIFTTKGFGLAYKVKS